MIVLMKVLYKGIECKIIYDYRNGYFEIKCLDDIILVDGTQIEILKVTT